MSEQTQLLNMCLENFPVKVDAWCHELGMTKRELRVAVISGELEIGMDCEIHKNNLNAALSKLQEGIDKLFAEFKNARINK